MENRHVKVHPENPLHPENLEKVDFASNGVEIISKSEASYRGASRRFLDLVSRLESDRLGSDLGLGAYFDLLFSSDFVIHEVELEGDRYSTLTYDQGDSSEA
jgi:hypothetical protein